MGLANRYRLKRPATGTFTLRNIYYVSKIHVTEQKDVSDN